MSPDMRPAPREWLLLLVLSGIQFSQMVDFMVLMPLGTQLMRAFEITPTQLGFFVSIYAVAASFAGFFSALVIDRFDRKTAMLALYACFAATMAACALAQLRAVFGETNHLRIFAFSALLVFSGFLVFPFIAPYLVTNVGVSEAQLPLA